MPHQTFRTLPNIDFNSPNVRTLDLDGDGRADLLVDEGNAFIYYRSDGRNGFKLESKFIKGNDEDKSPRIIFADYEQTIFLADMSGDGLTDIVRVRNGSVCYWPNLGHGRFGAKVCMEASPMMDRPGQFNETRVKLADVDGSGAADLIYINAHEISVWLNKSGNGFTKEARKFSLRSDNLTQISVLDFYGLYRVVVSASDVYRTFYVLHRLDGWQEAAFDDRIRQRQTLSPFYNVRLIGESIILFSPFHVNNIKTIFTEKTHNTSF